MMPLSTQSNFSDPDTAYRLVVEAHRGLGDEQSAALDAALVLILANHIGDIDVLRAAIALAKRRLPEQPSRHSGARAAPADREPGILKSSSSPSPDSGFGRGYRRARPGMTARGAEPAPA